MVRNFDHITIVVRDVAAAKGFFALLGFKEIKSVVISGKIMEDYMGIKGIEADHVALAIENPHTEVQLLSYRHPEMIADTDIAKLNKVGFNHICFAVDDLEAEVAKQGPQPHDGFSRPQACFCLRPRRRDRRTGAVALIPAALRPCRALRRGAGWGEGAHIYLRPIRCGGDSARIHLRRRRRAVPRSRLLPAAAIKGVAILAGVTIVKMPQTFPATFAGFFRHKTIGAMGKSLILDGRRCFSGEQAHADTSENEDRSLHGILPFAAQAHTRGRRRMQARCLEGAAGRLANHQSPFVSAIRPIAWRLARTCIASA